MARRYYGRKKYYRKSSRPIKRMRYSAECSMISVVLSSTSATAHIPIAPATNLVTNTFGMRKAKNFTLTLATSSQNAAGAIAFALVYWPEVYANAPDTFIPQISEPVNGSAVSMYEPNQNVIMQGIWSLGESSFRSFSCLARNLNSGDTLMLVLKLLTAGGTTVTNLSILGSVKFAIGYN